MCHTDRTVLECAYSVEGSLPPDPASGPRSDLHDGRLASKTVPEYPSPLTSPRRGRDPSTALPLASRAATSLRMTYPNWLLATRHCPSNTHSYIPDNSARSA